MSTENTETDLNAAFEGGFENARQPEAEKPAPVVEEAAPASTETVEAKPAETVQEEPVDELAGLPPKAKAMLAEFEALKANLSLIPGLEKRLRGAEGRLGDLNSRVTAAPPPPPPRLEMVERVRSELPEVIEAMEEMLQSRAPKDEPKAEPVQAAAPSILDEEVPDWQAKVISPEFQTWLQAQDAAYRQKVQSTNSEAVMLTAITRFDVQKTAAATQQAAAAKVAQTRNSRVAAAVVPQGAGRRAPTLPTEEDYFAQGFASQRI
jgi:hypothetical protein